MISLTVDRFGCIVKVMHIISISEILDFLCPLGPPFILRGPQGPLHILLYRWFSWLPGVLCARRSELRMVSEVLSNQSWWFMVLQPIEWAAASRRAELMVVHCWSVVRFSLGSCGLDHLISDNVSR